LIVSTCRVHLAHSRPHTALKTFLFGGLVIGYFSEEQRGKPLQSVQAKPKTPLPKITSQKGGGV